MIPEHATCVYDGNLFKVYAWPQEMFDGSVQTFERVRKRDSTQVIPVVGDRILIVHEEQPLSEPRYGLVGGMVDWEEETRYGRDRARLEAGRRELLEETGYRAQRWEHLFDAFPGGTKIDYTVGYFLASGCERVAEPRLDPGERITPYLVTVDEFVQRTLSDGFRSRPLAERFRRLLLEQGSLDAFLARIRSRRARP